MSTSVRPFSLDTSPEAQRFLIERWQEMPAWQKAQRVDLLSQDCARLALAGIRQQSPVASSARARFLLAVRRLGRDLALEAFGDDPCAERR